MQSNYLFKFPTFSLDFFVILFIVKVIKFNKSQPQPDAEDTDVIDGFNTSVEAGFRFDSIHSTATSGSDYYD